MRNFRFSPRQLLFLELFFSGSSMKDAVRAAGFRAQSPQSRCNRGRAILNKFNNNPQAVFSLGGTRGRRIAQLLVGMAHNGSELQQLKALEILSKCLRGG